MPKLCRKFPLHDPQHSTIDADLYSALLVFTRISAPFNRDTLHDQTCGTGLEFSVIVIFSSVVGPEYV